MVNIWLFLIMLAMGGLAGATLAYDSSLSYLDLQASSDHSHRLVIVALPICLAMSLLILVMAVVTAPPRRRLVVYQFVLAICTIFAGGLLGFIIRFDRDIEQKGTAGQLVTGAGRFSSIRTWHPVRGPFGEAAQVAGITTPEIEAGDMIVLDAHKLARKTPSGTTRWSRKRPGRAPASIILAGEMVLFLGPGTDFKGDVVVTAVDFGSGRLLWSFHCLGKALHAAPVAGGNLFYVAERSSVSSLGMLPLVDPKPGWSVLLPESVRLPPRVKPEGIQVAVGAKLYLYQKCRGLLLSAIEACFYPEQHGVVCTQGRITSLIKHPVKKKNS